VIHVGKRVEDAHVEIEETLELSHGRSQSPIEAEAQQLDGFGSSAEVRHVGHENVLRAELREAQDVTGEIVHRLHGRPADGARSGTPGTAN
jgi:hypothetical protein